MLVIWIRKLPRSECELQSLMNKSEEEPVDERMVRVATRTLVTSEAGTVGGGFNAGIPGKSDGSLGGGWTVTANGLEFGLGAVFNNISVNVAISADKITGALSVQVNGKEVAI